MKQTLEELRTQEKRILEDMKSDKPQFDRSTQKQMLAMIRSEIKHAKPKVDKNIKDLVFEKSDNNDCLYVSAHTLIGSYIVEYNDSKFELSVEQRYSITHYSFDLMEDAISFAQEKHKEHVTEFMALARKELYK